MNVDLTAEELELIDSALEMWMSDASERSLSDPYNYRHWINEAADSRALQARLRYLSDVWRQGS